jgi:hypothetical protein
MTDRWTYSSGKHGIASFLICNNITQQQKPQSSSSVRFHQLRKSGQHQRFSPQKPFRLQGPHPGSQAIDCCAAQPSDGRHIPPLDGSRNSVHGPQPDAAPKESMSPPWHRLGPYPPTGFLVDKDPVNLGNEAEGWCALCGTRSGWMQCGRCAGQGEHLTMPGKAGVKDQVGVARCKMCYGRGAVPCYLCGLTDLDKWNKWHAHAKRNPLKKKSK